MNGIRVIIANLIYSILAVTGVLLAFEADRFWPFRLPEQHELLAWLLMILGTSLILAAEYCFITVGHATGAPGNPPQQMVTTGIYRRVRNPIYIGEAMLLFGVAFLRNSPTMLLISVAFVPAIHTFVVCFEEPHTKRRFEAAYDRYKVNVPRWLPRLPRRGEDGNMV